MRVLAAISTATATRSGALFPIRGKMAYGDPLRAREAVKQWRHDNPELVKRQRRQAMIRTMVQKQRLPSLSVIARHELSDEDLRRIVHAVAGGRDEAEMVRLVESVRAVHE